MNHYGHIYLLQDGKSELKNWFSFPNGKISLNILV